MEFAAKALKPSLRSEFIFHQPLCEEILCFTPNTVVGGEDFSVDDLFDFSNGEFQHGSLHYEQQQEQEEPEEEEYELEKDNLSISSQSQDDNTSNSTAVSDDSIFSGELAVPADDLADLEWVSHFVDDSLSLPDPEFSLLYPVRSGSEHPKILAEPEPKPYSGLKKTPPLFPSEMKITTKARTVKSRKPKAALWSFSPLLSLPSSPSSCSSSTAKKQKKMGCEAQLQRRCSHCHVQKTPQWRTGPLGPKTLCNACGVRYKSGRLCSEYRPACSPTFSSDVHSNSHRKVLEIRRRKGIMAGPDTGLVQTQMVPSC